GHDCVVVGTAAPAGVHGKRGDDQVGTERATKECSAEEFDGLVIPGGYSPDKLRLDRAAVQLVGDMFQANKPVAAICHAASLLVEADCVRGRTLTSWPSVRRDVENAGGKWVDRELVEDGNLITSRTPDDLDSFCEGMLRVLQGARTTPHTK